MPTRDAVRMFAAFQRRGAGAAGSEAVAARRPLCWDGDGGRIMTTIALAWFKPAKTNRGEKSIHLANVRRPIAQGETLEQTTGSKAFIFGYSHKTGLRRRIKKSQSQAHDRPWGQLQGHEADRLPIPEVPNAQGPAQVPV